MNSRFWHWIKIFALVLPLGLTACGKQTFDKQKTTFVNAINNNWDFHFAILPLQRQDDLRSRWILAQDCTGLGINCVPASQASTYGGFYAAESGFGNIDDGFANMQANLSNSVSMSGSGFLRPDAMLVIIPFTNGNDVTGMTYNPSVAYPVCGTAGANAYDYCDRGDGQDIPNYSSTNAANSFNAFKNYLTNTVKPTVSLVSFYSVVAGTATTSPDSSFPCAGGTAWAGSRYINMANQIDAAYPGFPNGGAFDLCSGQLGSVLGSIATRMLDLVLAVEFNFVVLPERPVPGSLKIFKNGAQIPAQTTANGWTLYNVVGGNQQFTNNKATSYSPYPGNNKSGYFIELHGSAIFKGSDQITYTYEKF